MQWLQDLQTADVLGFLQDSAARSHVKTLPLPRDRGQALSSVTSSADRPGCRSTSMGGHVLTGNTVRLGSATPHVQEGLRTNATKFNLSDAEISCKPAQWNVFDGQSWGAAQKSHHACVCVCVCVANRVHGSRIRAPRRASHCAPRFAPRASRMREDAQNISNSNSNT